jgi:hypothetical protein
MPHYNLGVAYNKLELYEEEVDAYKQAISLKTGFCRGSL